MSEISQRLNLTAATFGALFCLTPLFLLKSEERYTTDDTMAFQRVTDNLLQRSPSLMASFFVVLIPAADLLLDLPHRIISHICPLARELQLKKPATRSAVFRLNEIERILFMAGIGVQSCVWFMSLSENMTRLGIVYFTTSNSSILLILGPILSYLQRCTTTFTSLRVTIIVLIAVIGLMMLTISNFYRSDGHTYQVMNYVGMLILTVAGLIFGSLIATCAFKFCRNKLNIASNRSISFLNTTRSSGAESIMKARESKVIDDDIELYTNYIPGLHMTASLIVIISYLYVGLMPTQYLTSAYERKNYIVIVAEVIVLVIELRIRKNEIARGLIALLESKKSYVRYISHELRTPLNTAFLGLKLLSSELKASKDPKDIERYETLCDVNMSCTAAVDILNDLLCYEKLESGILELHKENIVVDSFLKDFVLSFSVQARECGISVNTVTEVSHRDAETPLDDGKVSRSLLSDDAIYADKFKMDQVIRNLMSNALKFTPRGGTVTIKASFVYDSHEEAMRCVVDGGARTAVTSVSEVRRASRKAVGRVLRNPAAVACCPDSTSVHDTGGSPTRGKLVIVVTDTGAGISKENQARLFNEIVQFSPEKLQAGGGSGLGLWITQEILNLHDGSISVSSEGEGKGSSFTIEMPMNRCLADSSRTGIGPILSPAPDSNIDRKTDSERNDGIDIDSILSATTEILRHLPRYTHPLEHESNSNPLYGDQKSSYEVLIVDDSRLCRKMLQKCLRADGHTCYEAEDGLEAIAMVKERIDHARGGGGRPFDAVLMDFIMPNMDGPTATQEIRALGYKAPIFGVTGNGLPADIAHFLACGADRVLLKPLDMNAFGKAMEESTPGSIRLI